MWWLLWIALIVLAYLLIGMVVATMNYVISAGYRDEEWIVFDALAWPAIIVAVIGLAMTVAVKSVGGRILRWRGE